MITIKAWWKSLTVWLGGIVIVVSQIPPEVLGMLHPDVQQWAYTVAGVAIIYTRLRGTNQAVTLAAAMRPVTADKLYDTAGTRL